MSIYAGRLSPRLELKRKIKSLSQKKTKRIFQYCFQQVVVLKILYFSQPKGNEWIKCQEYITFSFSGHMLEAKCFSFLWLLYQIPTNLLAQNNAKLSSYGLGSQKSKIGLTGLKSDVGQGFFLEAQGENPFSCLF